MKIISVVGARPNFMKIAPFIKAIEKYNSSQNPEVSRQNVNVGIQHLLVHTGQHYDDKMSTTFFESLGIPKADINLGIGSGTHAEQVGQTMIAFEKVLMTETPDWVVVVGDVNATLACSVTAKKLNINVCHIEAGLRSGDMSMPEEINRLVTDRLSDLLLTPDLLSNENLYKEGVDSSKIKFVGNIMIDTLESNRDKALSLNQQDIIVENCMEEHASKVAKFDAKKDYALLTMHRPSNVDHRDILTSIFSFLENEVASHMQIIWPVHPRAKKQMQEFGLWERAIKCPNLFLLYPLGYHEMLRMNMDAKIMLTDSGGLQEECTVLGTPCLTLRWNTERPVTLREHGGASVLVGNEIDKIRTAFNETLLLNRKPERPALWDGQTAERCLAEILRY